MSALFDAVDSILALMGGAEIPAAMVSSLASYHENGAPIGEARAAALFVERREHGIARAARMAEEEARNKRAKFLETLTAKVAGIAIPDAMLAVLPEVVAANATIRVVALEGDKGFGFVVKGLKGPGNGERKGGRIADDAPSGYVYNGTRILGPLTKFAKANFSEDKLREIGAYTPQSNKFRAGAALAKVLEKVGVTADPLGTSVPEPTVSEDSETEETEMAEETEEVSA